MKSTTSKTTATGTSARAGDDTSARDAADAAEAAEAKRAGEVAELSRIPPANRGEATNKRLQELEVERQRSLPKAAPTPKEK